MRYINRRLLTYLLTCLVEMAIERRPHPCYRRTERLDGRTDGHGIALSNCPEATGLTAYGKLRN